jgi:hypothetical protein
VIECNLTAPRSYPCATASICIGFIFARGKLGFEGGDEAGLGIFNTPADTANAVFDAAPNERGAG